MINTKAAKRRMKRREQVQVKIGKLQAAFQFAKELVGIQTPKKTVLCSLMASNGLDLAQAKEMYKVARKKPRKRHH